MIKIIFTLVFFLFVALGGVWISGNSFPISAVFLDYHIETTAAKLAIFLLISLVLVYSILRLLSWVKNSPSRFASKLQKDKEKQGYRDLMRGFSALASGDMDYAKKLGDRAESALIDQPLVKLLQAQTSVLSNKPYEAEKYYSELTKVEESRIIGYRGLISQAIENRELPRALELAEDLHKLNPSSAWVNESMIDLAMRNEDWEKVERFTLKAKKAGSLTAMESKINLAIVHYFYARGHYEKKAYEAAIADLKLALKNNPKFMSATILLAQVLFDAKEHKAALKHIVKAWKVRPHPRLAEIYEQVVSETAPDKKLKKFEKLLKASPNEICSVMSYAHVALKVEETEKAKESILRGLEMRETRKLCLLMSEIEDREKWQARAANAESDKVWYCSQTGSEYPSWQLYSNSGFFNTIIWGYNQQNVVDGQNLQNQMDSFLLIK